MTDEFRWELLRGFDGQTFDTGPEMPQTGSMDATAVKAAEKASVAGPSIFRRMFNPAEPTPRGVLKTTDSRRREMNQAKRNLYANTNKTTMYGGSTRMQAGHTTASTLAGAYFTAMQAMNHQAAANANATKLANLFRNRAISWSPENKGGLLIVAVYRTAGPARSFLHCYIGGVFASSSAAVRNFDERGSIQSFDTAVQLWWGANLGVDKFYYYDDNYQFRRPMIGPR